MLKRIVEVASDLALMAVVLVCVGAIGCGVATQPEQPVASIDAELRITPSASGDLFRQPGSRLDIEIVSTARSEIHWRVQDARIVDPDTGMEHAVMPDDMARFFVESSGITRDSANVIAHSSFRRLLFTVEADALMQTQDGLAVEHAMQRYCVRD